MQTISLTDAITLFDAILNVFIPVIVSVYIIAIAFKIFQLFF